MKNSGSFIFRPGNVHGNVDLRYKHNSAIEFGLYADHFRNAAYRLAYNLEESLGYGDLDACPIAFLYRHALELYFKSIILIGTDIFKLQGKNLAELYQLTDSNNRKNIFTTHKLGELFPHVKEIFINMGWGAWPENEEGIPSLQEANIIVNDLDNVDSKSFAFRYPINKDGSPCEPRKVMFNIIDFSHYIQQFCEFLESVYLGLSDQLDNCCQYVYNQQSNF